MVVRVKFGHRVFHNTRTWYFKKAPVDWHNQFSEKLPPLLKDWSRSQLMAAWGCWGFKWLMNKFLRNGTKSIWGEISLTICCSRSCWNSHSITWYNKRNPEILRYPSKVDKFERMKIDTKLWMDRLICSLLVIRNRKIDNLREMLCFLTISHAQCCSQFYE